MPGALADQQLAVLLDHRSYNPFHNSALLVVCYALATGSTQPVNAATRPRSWRKLSGDEFSQIRPISGARALPFSTLTASPAFFLRVPRSIAQAADLRLRMQPGNGCRYRVRRRLLPL